MATVEQVYELIDRTCDIINRLFDIVGLNDDSEPAVRFELGKFMMYLSASDGTISVEEAEVISKISHLDVTPTNIGECIREHNIYSTEFEQTVPTVFNILINVDNNLIRKGIDISGSDILLSAYKAVGELAIKADGEVNENEKNDYRKTGATFETKKSIEAKQEILKKSKAFGGTYSDKDLMKVIGIARNSYYKYKKELQQEYH